MVSRAASRVGTKVASRSAKTSKSWFSKIFSKGGVATAGAVGVGGYLGYDAFTSVQAGESIDPLGSLEDLYTGTVDALGDVAGDIAEEAGTAVGRGVGGATTGLLGDNATMILIGVGGLILATSLLT